MKVYKTYFTLQNHFRKSQRRSHWDLRVVSPNKRIAWSWAFPKAKFPEKNEKFLAIRTNDHKISFITFQGSLKNGDKINLYDSGKCTLYIKNDHSMLIEFEGKKIIGSFNFFQLRSDGTSWMVTMSKKNKIYEMVSKLVEQFDGAPPMQPHRMWRAAGPEARKDINKKVFQRKKDLIAANYYKSTGQPYQPKGEHGFKFDQKSGKYIDPIGHHQYRMNLMSNQKDENF